LKIHLDTDVIMDVITARHPWAEKSGEVLNWSQRHPMSGSIAWHSLANLLYLTSASGEFLTDLTRFLRISPVENTDFDMAMRLNLPDPEDAMQVACALRHQAQFIITRNKRHYRNSPVQALTPAEFLRQLPG
jgi:predicted nucleic acid-binding protein